MRKMVKTGFRGERKENPHPDHILSYSETSPKERRCRDERRMMNEEGNVVKTSPYIHTRLLPTIPKEDFLPKSIFIIENALVQELKRIVSNLKNNYI